MSILRSKSVAAIGAHWSLRSSVLCCTGLNGLTLPSSKFIRCLSDGGKYPIQNWGYEYILRQQKLKRPISPHLTIYANDWSWTTSGAHRIFGCVLGCGAAIFCAGMMIMPFDFTAFIQFLHGLGVPSPIWAACRFLVAFMITFHAINGVRFLGMDLAKFMNDSKQIVIGAKVVLGLSLILASFFAFVMPMMSS